MTLPLLLNEGAVAQTYRVRAAPEPFGGISNTATFFYGGTSGYYGSSAVIKQPDTLPRHYAVVMMDDYPWWITDSGLIFGNGLDEEGNGYYFRCGSCGMDPKSRYTTGEATFNDMNENGMIVGSLMDYKTPVIWQASGKLVCLDPIHNRDTLTRYQSRLEVTDFNETIPTDNVAAIAGAVDDDGTVYGTSIFGRLIVSCHLHQKNGDELTFEDNWSDWPIGPEGHQFTHAAEFNGAKWSGVSAPAFMGAGGEIPENELPDPPSVTGVGNMLSYVLMYPYEYPMGTYWGVQNGEPIRYNLIQPDVLTDDLEYSWRGAKNANYHEVLWARNGHKLVFDSQNGYTLDNRYPPSEILTLNRDAWSVADMGNGVGFSLFNDTGAQVASLAGFEVDALNARHMTIYSTGSDGTTSAVDHPSPQLVGRQKTYVGSEGDNYYRAVLLEENPQSGQYEAYDLNQMAAMPAGWNLEKATDINTTGIITAIAYNPSTTESKGAILLPVDIAVDANRDGVIQLGSASDQTTAEKPYKFWINNNHDGYCTVSGETSVQDDLQSGTQDSSSDYISCTRDLEDFSRIWISMKGVSQMLQGSSGISVGLQWEPIPGASGPTPSIKIYKAVEPDGGTGYVTDDGSLPGDDQDYADQQIAGDYDVAVEDKNGNTVIGSSPFILPNDFWSDLDDTHPKHLIFEGVTAGKGKLVLVFFDSNGNKIGEGGALYMDLRDIKNMYERWSCEQTETQNGGTPNNQANLSTYRLPAGSSVFSYQPNDPETQQYILYVHGWNMAPFDKDAFAQTAFKRLWWQGYKGRFGAFQWPVTYHAYDLSAIFDFDDGEYTAWQSAIPLQGLMNSLKNRFGGNVYVVAHSMGNVVTGEALRLAAKSGAGQLVNTYVATQAAVPGHCYDMTLSNSSDLLDFGPLGFYGPSTPNIYNNWLSSAQGNKVNFFNINDFALNGTHWQLDQKLKPDIRTYTYYYDSGDISVVQDLFKKAIIRGSGTPTILHLGSSSNVQDRYEIMAYASEPRSKALGGISDVDAGIFTPQWLTSLWPADSFDGNNYGAHPWHSAQFRFTNADQHRYWQALMEQFGLPTNNP